MIKGSVNARYVITKDGVIKSLAVKGAVIKKVISGYVKSAINCEQTGRAEHGKGGVLDTIKP